MAKKSPSSNVASPSVEEKLRALYSLQIVDRRIDEIRSLRGELPLEVEDLEDEITGLDLRRAKVQEDINQAKTEVKGHKLMIKNCQEKIAKYEEQQKNVRNNREFDAIAKEIEFQELEIQLAEKHIREFEASLESKTLSLESVEAKLAERSSHLDFKKKELDNIILETQREEELLLAKSETL